MARRKELLDSVASRCRREGAEGVLVLPLDLGEMGNNGKAVDAAVEEFGSESFYRGRQKGGPAYTVFELLLRQYSNFEEYIY